MKTVDKKNQRWKEAAVLLGSAAAAVCLVILDYLGILALGRAGYRIQECCATVLEEEVKS